MDKTTDKPDISTDTKDLLSVISDLKTQLRQHQKASGKLEKELEKEISNLTERNSTLSSTVGNLTRLVSYLLQKQFCSKSEKLAEHESAFNEIEQTVDSTVKNKLKTTPDESKKKNGGRKGIDPSIPRKDIHIDLPEEDKKCKCCGKLKKYMGSDTSEKFDIKEIELFVNRYNRKKYSCCDCEKSVIIAPKVESAVNCIAEPGVLAHMIVCKYNHHIPLYRKSSILQDLGFSIGRSTLSNWVIAAAKELTPLYDLILKQIQYSNYIQADETPLQVLKEQGRTAKQKSYMWMFKSGQGKYVYYEYQPTRNGDFAADRLSNFKGYLQTDKYAGYNQICSKKGVIGIKCWAHARRKFFEVYKMNNEQPIGLAYEVLCLIQELYNLETCYREESLNYGQVKIRRKSEAIPILEEIKKLLLANKNKAPPKSKIGNAIKYLLNDWVDFKNYLRNGKIDIDNNAAERMIKPFVIGRKNWLFSNTASGAMSSSKLYSIIETAKLHGVNPQKYLQWVLEKIPKTKDFYDLLPKAYIATGLDKKIS